jgi:16S rRNA (guanine966-N2)-methyltransferase
MRVIAGSARGVRLARVPAGTRPLSDRAREGLFASLGERVPGARFADLFAGTGAVGIEAVSRGASRSVLVERSATAVRTIRENVARASVADRATVVRADVDGFLRRAGERFELVFLDPPYDHPQGALRQTLALAAGHLEPGGILVLTRQARNSTDVVPIHWKAIKVLAYGDARLLVCMEDE